MPRRFRYRGAAVSLAAGFGAATWDSYAPGPPGFLVIMLAGIGLIGLGLVLLLMAGAALIHKRFLLAVQRLATAGFALAALPLGLLAADDIHLGLSYWHYHSVIAAAPGNGSEPVRFPWGDTAVTVIDGLRMRVLVYDRSGQTAEQIGHSTLDANGLIHTTEHLAGDFFIEHIDSD